jgi:ABC-type sugar transport system permease subunit
VRDVQDAVVVDDASRLQRFLPVTLTLMKPVLLISLNWVTSGNLNHLDIPFWLTGSGFLAPN